MWQKGQKGEKPGPYGLEISPSLRCNVNCLFCWRRGVDKIDYLEELPFEKYKEIIEDATELGVKEIKVIGGGDATVRKDIVDIMELIKKNNIYGYICTNGILFKEKDIERLVKSGWDYIKLSFHGPDAKTHDELTDSKGSFDKVIQNIKLFNQYKKKYKTDVPHFELGIVMVNKNYDKIIEMIELAHSLDVGNVFIEPITVYSELGEKLRLNDEQKEDFKEIAKKAYVLAKKYNVSTNLKHFFDTTLVDSTNKMGEILLDDKEKGFEHSPCFEPFYRMGIRVDGKIGPCGFLDEEGTENIKDKNLRDVWYGNYMNQMRDNMINQKLGEQCKRCCTTLVVNNLEIKKALKRKI